jgi:polar amino acid transport system ATP-binding protein
MTRRRTAIPGLDAPARTDLAVLKPFNATAAGKADDLGFARFVANLPWWLPAGLAFAFMMWPAIAYAQSVDYTMGDAFTALVRWLPFLVLQGFAFNILISVVTMALGTITGVVLGLMQISPNPAISRPAWLITQTFRNSPWLVLLFIVMLAFPFQIDLGFAVIPIPDWMKAVFGLALPIMANISEVVRGAINSVPNGQWEAAESLAYYPPADPVAHYPAAMHQAHDPAVDELVRHPHHGNPAGFAARRRGDRHPVAPGHGRRKWPPGTAGAVLRLLPRDLLCVLLSHRALDHRAGTQVRRQTLGHRPMPETWTPDQPIISIKDVHKSFGDLEVLKGVSFDVMKGEVICIIGPSGSGKSTLIRCINALNDIQSGSIKVEGQEVNAPNLDKLALRKKVGMVFQQYNLFPHKTALENVMMAPLLVLKQNPDEVEKRARELIRKVRLEGKENSYPGELSGGQQQRVAIARSLAMNPDVMLFDEVTAALDPETVKEVLVTIKDLAAEGMTCILVTHEMGFAREIADHIYFTDRGVIVEHGPPATFFKKAKDPRTREFLSQIL